MELEMFVGLFVVISFILFIGWKIYKSRSKPTSGFKPLPKDKDRKTDR